MGVAAILKEGRFSSEYFVKILFFNLSSGMKNSVWKDNSDITMKIFFKKYLSRWFQQSFKYSRNVKNQCFCISEITRRWSDATYSFFKKIKKKST